MDKRPAICRSWKCAPRPKLNASTKRYRFRMNGGKETSSQTFDVTSHHWRCRHRGNGREIFMKGLRKHCIAWRWSWKWELALKWEGCGSVAIDVAGGFVCPRQEIFDHWSRGTIILPGRVLKRAPINWVGTRGRRNSKQQHLSGAPNVSKHEGTHPVSWDWP